MLRAKKYMYMTVALEYFKLLNIKKKGGYSIMLHIQEIKNTINPLPYKDAFFDPCVSLEFRLGSGYEIMLMRLYSASGFKLPCLQDAF